MQGGRPLFSASIVFFATAVVAAAPVAGPRPRTWQLDVRFHDPQRISVHVAGDERPTEYWYFLYEVTNNTGRDVEFYPSFEIVTNRLEVIEAGDWVHPKAYDAIFARHVKEFPFLARPTEVTGRLLQGEANARASVAVFRMFDARASGFTVYGSGFSGDIERLRVPESIDAAGDAGPQPPSFLLRRTLAIRYQLPGDARTRGDAKPIRRGRQWVMR